MTAVLAVKHVLRATASLIIGLLFASKPAVSADDTLIAGVFTPARQAPDFSFTATDGSEVKLSQYRGKVVLLAFGYTACTDVCPVTLATLASVSKQLGPDAKGMQVIYVTVDPARDDAERMKRYVTAFNPSFIGVTGPQDKLAKIRKEYGIDAKKEKEDSKRGSYNVSHSSFIYLIDKQGKLQALMPYGHSPEDFAHDVRILLRRPAPAS